MRIRIPSQGELNPGHPKDDGNPNRPRIHGLLPTLGDCEIIDDNGKVITTEVESIDIRMRCGEPIVATVRRFDVSADIAAVQADRGPRTFEEGCRHALMSMAGHLISELNASGGPRTVASLTLAAHRERLELVSVLRRLCAKLGDNDWPDDLYLPDVIEKHLRWEK